METQDTICLWAEDTFGPVTNPQSLVARALQEMKELAEAIDKEDLEEIGKETADVVILLHRLLDQYQLDLNQEIEKKMKINRSRQWISSGDGTGKHIPKIPK
ncbi:nucleotide pyrophosphohydrolase [Kiloniella laminariae]|uniref:Nucleotide pyrophosphohydrolase n=1 Tax=Kiloniella laminariae TaxID=454162 RepID=A0ABT4LLU9_9PROT|nr:MazG nucleotide pyrophosphohydrolase domain-containing protein [Kiloniella laminariae]MCZ4282084.1 nucleotide pyrophosphohydrolase [Kiloniella laminariae]